jgi:hypothetical protein
VHEAERDEKFAKLLWIACSRDILFWVNTFAVMKESREGLGTQGEAKIFPWITWPVQDWLLTEMQASCGKENVVLAKPRAAAASWCVIALFFYLANFRHDVDFGCSSAKEGKVDAKDDPSSLFGKIDVLLRYMPKFLLPEGTFDRGPARFVNYETHSTIIGYASTGDLNTGGRNTAFLMDEFGDFPVNRDYEALETMQSGVTNSIFMVSTYNKRRGCAFNVTAQREKFPAKRLRVKWSDCPPQARGMYIRHPNKPPEILDPTPMQVFDSGRIINFPENYGFIDDGKLRSPYYDIKTRNLTKQQVARQFEADEEGSATPGLDQEAIKRLLQTGRETGRLKPVWRGRITFNIEMYGTSQFKVDFIRDDDGPLSLWVDPATFTGGRAPKGDCYATACDVSAGTGASDSSDCIMSRSSGKQVAEYVSSRLNPIKFADVAAALGWVFGGDEDEAYLTFDAIGTVGSQFRERIKELQYGHIQDRVNLEGRVEKRSDKLGYGVGPYGWGAILAELVDDCIEGHAEIRSEACLLEFGHYVFRDGKIEHDGVASADDETENAQNHGDRAVAAAMCRFLCRQLPYRVERPKPRDMETDPPYGSMAWRFLQQKLAEENAEDEFIFS